jgi:hypothetical protein
VIRLSFVPVKCVALIASYMANLAKTGKTGQNGQTANMLQTWHGRK